MKNKTVFSGLSLFLAVLMLIGTLPLGVFAFEGTGANAKPNYTEFRGENGMFEDSNGVMVYYGIEDYYKTSRKDVQLTTEYKTVDDSVSASNTSVAAYYDECPYLYADYAIYFDESIAGTTVKVRYGLSMQDAVYYVDSATGEIVKGDKSPIELTANNHNTKNSDYNAGFGMVYGEDGELEYTTRYYAKKGIIFYILNHRASERIGQEDDVSILTDYIEQGYIVVTVDFKANENAVTPYIENALVSLRAMFDTCTEDEALRALGVTTDTNSLYFLPEGCRVERDVWFWDPSIFGVSGTMESFRQTWNEKISFEATGNQTLSNPKIYDTLGIGSVDSVEEMITTVTKKDGTPIEYKQSMDIIYPSQPKAGYKVPLYVQEGTLEHREQNVLTGYTRVTFTSFALNGYACVEYDHPYWPFLYRYDYYFKNSGGDYGLRASSANNARAAVRLAKYLAAELGYSNTLVGAGGISKATPGVAVLSIKNNKQLPQDAVTAFGVTYDNSVYEGDILVDGTVTKAILQPFMYYDEEGTREVSSDCAVTYNSSGGGVEKLFGEWADYEKVPMVLSGGLRDDYSCYNYWEKEVAWFDANATEPFLPITQLDQGHTYPVGYDTEHGYYRTNAMLKFFDTVLKPEMNAAPEVLWVTPVGGSRNVPVTGKWTVGPYTPFGWEIDSYDWDQTIQIRFVTSVDPASVKSGVTVTTEGGKKVKGTWVASEQNALYTFESYELAAGTKYNINVTSGVKGENGVALAEERTFSFTTEGTYLVKSVADTYVSKTRPDTAFGEAGELKSGGEYITLISFEAENITEAENLLLRADVALEATPSFKVYALSDTLVDGAEVTYSTLIASDAWENKVLIGEYTIEDGALALDLSSLAEPELGRYVTLAFVPAVEPNQNPHVYFNDFETPTIGTAIQTSEYPVTDNNGNLIGNGTYDVVARNGKVTDARSYWVGSTSYALWRSTSPASPYMWARSGSTSDGWLIDGAELSSTQIFRVKTQLGQGQKMKFFNTTTNDRVNGLTSADIGKTFRVTFDIYPIRDLTLTIGMTAVSSAEFTGKTVDREVSANEWTTVTCELTLTEAMVAAQAGLVSIQLQYPNETPTYTAYTYFDNLSVKELIPSFTAEKGAFSLISTKSGMPLNQPITVFFDEAMDLSSFAEGMTVKNENSGKRIAGEWQAVGDDNTTFAFVTKGLVANTTYSVSSTKALLTLAGTSFGAKLLKTVVTEGDYAVRPIATSYVSVAEPKAHFGLDVTPILDGDKLGVITFSAKTLKNATASKLYLDVATDSSVYFNVYALTDVALDSTLCYDTVAGKLTEGARLGGYAAEDGKLALDLEALCGKVSGETLTLVLAAGHHIFNDFETPRIGTAVMNGEIPVVSEDGKVTDARSTYNGVRPWDKNIPASPYIWCKAGGSCTGWLVTDTDLSSSQLFQTRSGVGSAHSLKFFNTTTRDSVNGLTQEDVGKKLRVTFDVYPSRTLTFEMGVMAVTSGGFTGAKVYGKALADQWNSLGYTVTITQDMVNAQAGLVTLALLYPTEAETYDAYTYFDNLRVREIVDYTVTMPVEGMMLMTENEETLVLTDADKPVADEIVVVEPLPNLDASLVSYQVTKGENGEFSVRLIAGIDALSYKRFGYEITVTDAEGTRTLSGQDTRVYTALYGGETLYSIKEELGYEYAALATVKGLALDSDFTELVVRTYVVTREGETQYGRGATLVYTGMLDSEGYSELAVVAE